VEDRGRKKERWETGGGKRDIEKEEGEKGRAYRFIVLSP
jgi:hypothetical protein